MALGAWEEIKPRITTALESGFDCVLVDRENIEKVRLLENGKIKVACFGAERGSEDILVVGRGGEGDGTVALPKDPKNSQPDPSAALRRPYVVIAATIPPTAS